MCVDNCSTKAKLKAIIAKQKRKKMAASLVSEQMRKLASALLSAGQDVVAARLVLAADSLEKTADLHAALSQNFPGLSEEKRVKVAEILVDLVVKNAAELTTAGRKHIATKNFAIKSKAQTPSEKAESGNYPIHDIAHARNALARVAQHGSPEEIAKVRRAVYAKYPSLRKNKEEKED